MTLFHAFILQCGLFSIFALYELLKYGVDRTHNINFIGDRLSWMGFIFGWFILATYLRYHFDINGIFYLNTL